MQHQMPPILQQSEPVQPSTTVSGVFWPGHSCGTALASGSGSAVVSACVTATSGAGKGAADANDAARVLASHTGLPSFLHESD